LVAADELTPEEQETHDLVALLVETGDLHPLIAHLREARVGPERARDALRVLADLDVDLLIQVTLDGLIGAYLAEPGLAYQPRRDLRGGETAD
jgi:hypothetical protein